MGDPNNPLSDAKEILDSELVKNLLSPSTKEIGQFLSTVANLARFYATENLESIFTKWARVRRGGRIIDAEAFKKVMPLLPLASMVSEDELPEKWAALMESTATEDRCLPSFGLTLSQLTVEEVQYLDRLWKVVTKFADFVSVHRFGRDPLSHSNLVQLFNPDISTWAGPAEFNIFGGQFSDTQKADYERLGHARLVIEDLIRLGIIGTEQVAMPTTSELIQTTLSSQYSFSE